MGSIRQSEIDACKNAIAAEESAQANAAAWQDIISAKKEAVSLQLESVYRSRLTEAHQQVKKRLDYQLETANVMRRMEQKHMVDWIISNVKKSLQLRRTLLSRNALLTSRRCLWRKTRLVHQNFRHFSDNSCTVHVIL